MQVSSGICSAAVICGLITFGACSRGPLPETPLTAADLPADTFTIQQERDTTLQTPGGARLQIPAGALSATGSGPAKLVVREAYTIGRMLRGALATLGGNDILSSGGLIQIAAGAGTGEKLARPLALQLPASVLRPGMQLWRDTGDRQRRFGWQQQMPVNAGTPAAVPSFGWIGTGAPIKEMEGFENSQLLAEFDGPEKDGISVYLLLPDDGIVLEGGPAISGAGSYAFYRNDGTVPLRHGKKAIVLGVKRSGGQWLYAAKSFTAAPSQEIRLELRVISKQDLDKAFDDLGG